MLEGLATRAEVKERWDLVDLLEAHEVLDLRIRAQDYEMEKAKANAGGRQHGRDKG